MKRSLRACTPAAAAAAAAALFTLTSGISFFLCSGSALKHGQHEARAGIQMGARAALAHTSHVESQKKNKTKQKKERQVLTNRIYPDC